MPLPILLILVIGGISAVALCLHLLGLSRVARWNEEGARAAWLRQFPDSEAQAITLNSAGTAALVRSDAGRGLVWQFGADSVAHLLSGHSVTPHRRGARVSFADFAVPSVTLTLSEVEKNHWIKELAAHDG